MSFTDTWRTVVPETIRTRFAAKLLLALLAVIGLTAGFGVFVQTQTADDLRADANTELTTTAEIRGETLDTWLSGVKKQTRLTSQHPAVTSGETDRVREHLRSLVGGGTVPEAVIAVHYYDTEAKVIRTSSASRLEGVSPAENGAPFARNPPSFEGPSDTYVSDPFSVSVVDHPVLTVISPVPGVEDRAVIYMIDLRQRVESLTTVQEGSIVVVNDDGEFVSHPDTSRIGDRWGGMRAMRAADSESGGETSADRATDATFVERGDTITAATAVGAADWTVVVRTPREAAYALGESVTSGILGLILLMMATLGLVGAVVGSDTVSSLRQIAVRANRMAEGDLDVSLEARREDEFADLVETFTEMRDSLKSSLSDAETARAEAERARSEAEAQAERLAQTAEEYETVMRAVADGDLTRRIDADTDDEAMRAIGEAFNEMVADIERTLADVTTFSATVTEAVASTADSVAAATEANDDVRASVSEIADGATQQAEDLTTVESEMGQLSASAEEVASTVETAAATSRRAADVGDTGRERAEEALAEMEAIREQTEASTEAIETLESEVTEIAEIAELIGDIADQTNLLALNASIEAARAGGDGAGDAGDGFAVVADEVKSLAEETKESAEEVESRIAAIRSHTEDTVAGMHETGDRVRDGTETVEAAIESLEEIVENVESVDNDIQEIASATEQQARSSEAVVDTVEEVASISEETSAEAATVDEATSRQTETLSRVADDADGLAERTERLQELLANFEIDTESMSGTGAPGETGVVRASGPTDDAAASDGGDRR